MSWYLAVLRNYTGFSGRAHRTEFWMFFLVNLIIGFILDALTLWSRPLGIIGGLYGLAVLLPSLAVGARRLHDIERTGWWQLFLLLPVIGTIILIVFWAQDSQPGSNEYGANPKTAPAYS